MKNLFRNCLMLLLAISLVALGGAVTDLQAAKEKYFDRDGYLVVKDKEPGDYKRRAEEDNIFPVPPPPFSEGIFPCSECHDYMEVNRQRRQLEDEHLDMFIPICVMLLHWLVNLLLSIYVTASAF